MSDTSVLWRGVRVAASATAIVLAAHAVQAQTAIAPVAQPGAAAGQDATAQQIREELDRLRREFESVRDTYGARLTALEAKLAQFQGAPAPRRTAGGATARGGTRSLRQQVRLPAAPPTEAAQRPTAAGPAGRRRRRRPRGSAAGLRQHGGIVEGLQPRHGRDRQLPRRGRQEPDRHARAARDAGSGSELPGRRRSVRARGLLPLVRAGGRRGRGRLHHVHIAARRAAGEGRQDARAVRQGEHDARARAAVGRRAARDEEPARGRGRHRGLRASRSRS